MVVVVFGPSLTESESVQVQATSLLSHAPLDSLTQESRTLKGSHALGAAFTTEGAVSAAWTCPRAQST